jgi:ferredoxin
VEEKQTIKIGLAYIDRNRCLPYASARTCIVCEEHCPTPKKAIWFEEAQVTKDKGEKVTVKQPRVNLELCIGCGICTNKCVIKGQPAILVSSVGESRKPETGGLVSGRGWPGPYGSVAATDLVPRPFRPLIDRVSIGIQWLKGTQDAGSP